VIALVRGLFWAAAVCLLLWFSLSVPLGSRTLWQHARAIAGTREARELAAGAAQSASLLGEAVRRALHGTTAPSAPPPARPGGPGERLEQGEREQLDRLVEERTGAHPAGPVVRRR
jgi:hypothetical protein